MYPVRIGFSEVIERIKSLRQNGHHAEALVTSVFTLEKLMRRSMRMAILARGFTSRHADSLLANKGFKDLQKIWEVFDKNHNRLPAMIAEIWQNVPNAVTMRNKLVHGTQTFNRSKCETTSAQLINALEALHAAVEQSYGADPWQKLKARKQSRLQWLPPRTEAP